MSYTACKIFTRARFWYPKKFHYQLNALNKSERHSYAASQGRRVIMKIIELQRLNEIFLDICQSLTFDIHHKWPILWEMEVLLWSRPIACCILRLCLSINFFLLFLGSCAVTKSHLNTICVGLDFTVLVCTLYASDNSVLIVANRVAGKKFIISTVFTVASTEIEVIMNYDCRTQRMLLWTKYILNK